MRSGAIVRTLAIIPARGGSKRIPGKNIKLFCGKPMIAYSIEVARSSGLFDHVVVSTESDEVAAVARACGAEVPFRRPAELANDFTGTDAVFLHAILESERLYGAADFSCCIYATVPLLSAERLRAGLEKLESTGAAAAVAVTTFDYPVFRALRAREGGPLEWQWPEHAATRSQDLPQVVHEAGQFYWVDVARFKKTPDTLVDAVPVDVPRWTVQDVDTAEDWDLAERLYAVATMQELRHREVKESQED